MAAPLAVVDLPPGWVAVEIARPAVAEATGARWSSWSASRAPDGEPRVVAACVEAHVPGWVEDMRPAFAARTVALVGATAERIVGAPVETFEHNGALGLRRVGASSDAEPLGSARTFLGFDGDHAATCFVVCASSSVARSRDCHSLLEGARLEGGDAPPRPSLGLRAVTWAVHHPRPTAAAFGAVVVVAGWLAVTTRRRAKFRA